MKKLAQINIQNKNLKSICIELNPSFNEHVEVFEILKKYFKRYSKENWHQGQEVFNHIFYKI